MCGITGGIGERNVVPVAVEGLKRLEYRGYDSVGIATIDQDILTRVRVTGRVKRLEQEITERKTESKSVIGHTRWATHGKPCEKNAHPQFSNGKIGIVHNGIIENYLLLHSFLTDRGYEFESDTDTEVIAHLIHYYQKVSNDFPQAVMLATEKLKGQYAIGVINADYPDTLVVSRQGSPLVLGVGIGESFFASDVSALLPVTSQFIYLEDGDTATVTTQGFTIFDKKHVIVTREIVTSGMSVVNTELGIFRHFMQKEIFEQPKAIADTLQSVIERGIHPQLFGPEAEDIFKNVKHITILACGTSHNAGLIARNWIEKIARIPVNVEIASEYKYRDVAHCSDLVIAISQSGETADTIAAAKNAQAAGAKLLSICNVPESFLTRISDLKFMTKAGQEIGVASTKAFTTQLVALRIFAYCLAKAQNVDFDESMVMHAFRTLPHCVKLALAVEPEINTWAKEFAKHDHAIFLGRGTMYPIAEEGSLKLKEISYIHAEAYPCGELKHGPLALIDDKMPIVMLLPKDKLLEKNLSSMQEVSARDGRIFLITQYDVSIPENYSECTIKIVTPEVVLDEIAAVIPLQLLAYHTALIRGTDVDKPRHLAKSVATE